MNAKLPPTTFLWEVCRLAGLSFEEPPKDLLALWAKSYGGSVHVEAKNRGQQFLARVFYKHKRPAPDDPALDPQDF